MYVYVYIHVHTTYTYVSGKVKPHRKWRFPVDIIYLRKHSESLRLSYYALL